MAFTHFLRPVHNMTMVTIGDGGEWQDQ